MRSDIGWAVSSDGSSGEPPGGGEVAWLRVSMRSRVSKAAPAREAAVVFEEWEAVLSSLEAQAPPEAGKARQTCALWVKMATELE
eukprot:scaffold380138_cov36-Prasinocladus_malaysianus.AAC.1